jgi:hypothetical protein
MNPLLSGIPIHIFEDFKQPRKHRKKRINKKWRKRYGYAVKTPLEADQVIFVSAPSSGSVGCIYMNRTTYENLKRIGGIDKW